MAIKSFNLFLRVIKLNQLLLLGKLSQHSIWIFFQTFVHRKLTFHLMILIHGCNPVNKTALTPSSRKSTYSLWISIKRWSISVAIFSFSFTQFFPPCFVDNVLLSRRFNHVTLFFGNTSDVIAGARNSKMAAPMKIAKLFRFPIFMN